MNPIPVPTEAAAGRPECTVVAMGPPQGVSGDDCGTAQMLISPVEQVMPGFIAKRQYAYFRPSPAELAQLGAGGFIETCQYGSVVQPFSATVWPAAAPSPSPSTSVDSVDAWHCENDHGEPRWAVALLHLVDSMSAANVTALCGSCLSEWLEVFVDEQLHGTAEAWEIRPLAVGGCPGHNATIGPHHDQMCALWDSKLPAAQGGPDLKARVLARVDADRPGDAAVVERIASRIEAGSLTDDPTDPRLTRGVDTEPVPQAEAYLVLSEDERAKGFVRPLRRGYLHVGRPGPTHETRDLTAEEQERYAGAGYVQFEPYPGGDGPTGRFWTQEQLDSVGKGCGALTTMSEPIAATYARDPKFYGATYCVHCSKHLPVEEFRWDADGRVVGS